MFTFCLGVALSLPSMLNKSSIHAKSNPSSPIVLSNHHQKQDNIATTNYHKHGRQDNSSFIPVFNRHLNQQKQQDNENDNNGLVITKPQNQNKLKQNSSSHLHNSPIVLIKPNNNNSSNQNSNANSPSADTPNSQQQNVYDISDWQGSLSNLQGQELKSEVPFMILKADQGGYEDADFPNNSAVLQNNGVPYGAYDYSVYSNPVQAQNEARALYTQAPNAKFYVNDAEINNAGAGLDNSTNAWASEIHALTNKPAVLYSDLSFLNSNLSQATRNNYNAIWVAAYGAEPDPSWHYDLWQYTDNHYSPSLNEDVDASTFPDGNDKPLSFWTGGNNYQPVAGKHTPSPTPSKPRRPKRRKITKPKRKRTPRKVHRKHVRHVVKPRKRRIHRHRRRIRRHRARKLIISKNYYHSIPADRWLKIKDPKGINLYTLNDRYMAHVPKGITLYVNHYYPIRGKRYVTYRAVGNHWGQYDKFTANKHYVFRVYTNNHVTK